MIFDGDVNTNWRLAVGGDQAKEGNLRTYVEDGDWFEWDLGATFWVDHLSHLDLTVGGGEGSRGSYGHGAKLFILTTSDGTPASGLTSDRIRSNFDYQELSDVSTIGSPTNSRITLHSAAENSPYLLPPQRHSHTPADPPVGF